MKKKILIILIYLATFSLANAQRKPVRNFDGPFSINQVESGNAKYQFFLDENEEEVLHGNFFFSSESMDTTGLFIQRKINGIYSEGLKDKNWTYTNNTFKVNIKTITDRFQVQSTVSGLSQKLEANFDQGKPTGKWRLEESLIEESRTSERLKFLEANFRNGRMIGGFEFEGVLDDEKIHIKGQFNPGHFFDGVWNFSFFKDTIEYKEERIYDDGFLVSLVQRDITNNIVLHEITYDRVKSKLLNSRAGVDEIDYKIGDDFFGIAFDDGFPFFSEEEISQKFGNDLLARVFNLITDKGSVTGLELSGIDVINPGATRRFEYTLTSKEKDLLEQALVLAINYSSDLEKFVNNTTLSLNKQRSDSLSFSYRYAERMLENFNVVKENIELLQSDYFKYQSKRTYYRAGIEGLPEQDTIRYNFDGEQRLKVIPNPITFSDSDAIVQNIFDFIRKKGEVVDSLDPFFKESILEIEQYLVSQQLEEDLILFMNKIEETFEVQRGVDAIGEDGVILTRFHISMYENYQNKLNLLMQDYSNIEDFEEKQEVGLRILNLIKTYLDAYEPVGEVRKKLQQLDEAYTKMSYNPYMDRHDIKTRIKRNIYFAAVDHLLPDYRERIINVENFEEIPSLISEMNIAFDRLFEIAKLPDSETRSMERRLRRESNPSRIKRILEI